MEEFNIRLAVALFVAYILLSYALLTGPSASQEFDLATVDTNYLSYPPCHVRTPNRASNHFSSDKFRLLNRNIKAGYVQLEVFKGREAKLNRAIIIILSHMEPQTTRAIYKAIIQIRGLKNTGYATVNKRVRDLEKQGYLKVQVKQSSGGFTNYYELRPQAYLAKYFDSSSIDELIKQASDKSALIIFSTLIGSEEQELTN